MNGLKRLWVTGYRSYELGVFSAHTAKYKVLQYAMKDVLKQAIDDGFTWLITGAQLGTEQWSVTAATALKKKYDSEFQIAVMLPYLKMSSKWSSNNQLRFARTVKRADFSRSVSNSPYESPVQLFNYQRFMLGHTDAAILFYDPDHPGKSKYDYQAIKNYQKRHNYDLKLMTMDDLQAEADEFQEIFDEKRQRG